MKKTFLPIWILLILLAACSPKSSETTPDPKETLAALEEAYIYGLPLVIMDISRLQMMDSTNVGAFAAPNTFNHRSQFPDATFKSVVRPNADTYYSSGWVDLSAEPVVLSVPNSGGRYYMLPMLDMYTNVFSSPGTRTTGNEAQTFLITGPGWTGEVPEGMTQIQSPTAAIWIIGRTQVNSKEDGEKVVVPFQKNLKLSPLSFYGKEFVPTIPAEVSKAPKGDPNSVVKAMDIQSYFSYLNQLMERFPGTAADSSALRKFESLGVGAGKTFDLATFPETLRDSISALPTKLFKMMDDGFASKGVLTNGWNTGRPVIGTYGTDYLSRALVAVFGLGANLREDAIYPSCGEDSEGNPLNGANRYVIRFEAGQTPPANAFWSLTMYDVEGFFIPNPVNRFAIGDRSNLKANPDGSVEIYIQKDNPGKDKESNWLPAPEGAFNLLMRVYWPKDNMLNGSWTPPAVVKQ